MPDFCTCCQPPCDTYVCQQCGAVRCSGKCPPVWGPVPRAGRKGNLCQFCWTRPRTSTPADAKLEAQRIFANQERIYPDACDVGIRIDDGQNPDVREAVWRLVQLYKPRVVATLPHGGRVWGFGSFRISYCNDEVRRIKFLSYEPM